MPNSDPTYTIILGEISIILTILIFIILGWMITRKRRQSKLLTMMLKRVAGSEGERKKYLLDTFSNILCVDSTTINCIIQDIAEYESEFYRLLSSAFIKNEFSYFENIDTEIHKLVAPYGKLASSCKTSSLQDSISVDKAVTSALNNSSDAIGIDVAQESLSDPEFDLSHSEHDLADNDNIQSQAPGIAVIPDDLLDNNDSRG